MTTQVVHTSPEPGSLDYIPRGQLEAAEKNCTYTQSYQLFQKGIHYLYLSYNCSMQASKHMSTWHWAAPIMTSWGLQGVSHPSFLPAFRMPVKSMLLTVSSGWNHTANSLPVQEADTAWGHHHQKGRITPLQPPGYLACHLRFYLCLPSV